MRRVHNFGHNRHTCFLFRFQQKFQALGAHPLECIRRGARFERAAAQNVGTRFFYIARDGQNLFAAFHRAGPCEKLEIPAADFYAVHINHRIIGVEFAVGVFIRLGNTLDLFDNIQALNQINVHFARVAYKPQNRLVLPHDRVHRQPLIFEPIG